MCGIYGEILSSNTNRTSVHYGSIPLQYISPRGPDSHAVRVVDCAGYTVTMAHTRLAILELSELGAQPMVHPSGRYILIFNGEIYNYIEIRDELVAVGAAVRGGSDTEVLLQAWARWGSSCLDRLNGMFAFALLDKELNQLWLVRDRFGIKPLLWGRIPGGGISFSSSVAAVASQAGADVDLEYCTRALHSKVFESRDSGSPFTTVYSVPSGSWLRFDLSEGDIEITERRWYDLAESVAEQQERIKGMDIQRLAERCQYLLRDAVHLRLRSDVPVAVSLSGGLDSSTVASIALGQVPSLTGFSYGDKNHPDSEGPVVEGFSRKTGVNVQYVWPRYNEIELGDVFEQALAAQEAPFTGLSVLAQREVYRSVKHAGFKVLLGGQGADEAFAGYRKFFLVALRQAIHYRSANEAITVLFSLGKMLLFEAHQFRVYWQNKSRYFSNSTVKSNLWNGQSSAPRLLGTAGTTLVARQIDDVLSISLPTLLRFEDRNSMSFGVESRLPFMDYRLVELALALPTALKLHDGFGKWALRAITDGMVPDHIRLNRTKRGFDVTQKWITDGVGARVRQMILSNTAQIKQYLKPGVLLERSLTDAAFMSDPNLFDEAMLLAWLTQPVREPVRAHSCQIEKL